MTVHSPYWKRSGLHWSLKDLLQIVYLWCLMPVACWISSLYLRPYLTLYRRNTIDRSWSIWKVWSSLAPRCTCRDLTAVIGFRIHRLVLNFDVTIFQRVQTENTVRMSSSHEIVLKSVTTSLLYAWRSGGIIEAFAPAGLSLRWRWDGFCIRGVPGRGLFRSLLVELLTRMYNQAKVSSVDLTCNMLLSPYDLMMFG